MAAREDMYRVPVDVENISLEVDLDLNDDEVAIGGVRADGSRILYKAIDDGTGKGLYPVVIVGGNLTLSPGTVITTVIDTAIGAGVTVPLPAIPSNTLRVTVQNTGPAGTLVRVREIGGPLGSGVILARYSSVSYGGFGGAIAALEAQEIAGIATSVAVQFERL